MKYVPTGLHAELIEVMRHATKGTPYIVIETPEGFELEGEFVSDPDKSDRCVVDIVRHKVRLNERSMRYTVTGGHTQRATSSADVRAGRIHTGAELSWSLGVRFEIGRREDGSFGIIPPPVNCNTGRHLILDNAAELGWTRRTSVVSIAKITGVILCVVIPFTASALYIAYALL